MLLSFYKHTYGISKTLINDKTFAIIGGGPAGLSIAKLLSQQGAKVNVYDREKSQNSRVQGSCLDLHQHTGLKVIRQANIYNEFQNVCHKNSESLKILDKAGKIIVHIPNIKAFMYRPEIDRGKLRDLFITSLEPETIQWDHKFDSLTKTVDNKNEITFENGNKVIADVVIGADGYRSKIRPYLTKLKPFYSGITAFSGEIENPKTKCLELYNLVDQGLACFISDEVSVHLQHKGDNCLYFVIFFKCSEVQTLSIDTNNLFELKEYLKSLIKDWDRSLHYAIDQVESFMPWPLYSMPFDSKNWVTSDSITLLGDAAHVMVPSGEGANHGMYDAYELVESLTNGKNSSIHAALEEYEEKMFQRTSPIAKHSIDFMNNFHAKNAVTLLPKSLLGPIYYVRQLFPVVIGSLNWITDRIGMRQ